MRVSETSLSLFPYVLSNPWLVILCVFGGFNTLFVLFQAHKRDSPRTGTSTGRFTSAQSSQSL